MLSTSYLPRHNTPGWRVLREKMGDQKNVTHLCDLIGV